ncbi:group III truncated hemoglobin [Pedobacter glucosidilyticus]|uniref:group III truncated hemoglobin n=1 Tax=Pedobacter glucosidilyticus TaxID=1122941 RepID=UPI0026F131AA|nr:group III truncated hemoglobin [Pedobacter glucosidilyticus]
MKKDIASIDDIQLLVDTFYDNAVKDPQLGHIFNDVAKVNWQHHLPIMYKFWASTLLGEVGYTGNPMDAHFRLNEKIPLNHEAFNSWKNIFMETVDQFFEGPIANEAKKKAISIADLMFYKIHNYNQSAGVNIGKVRRD